MFCHIPITLTAILKLNEYLNNTSREPKAYLGKNCST